jgi:hypothetical protein
MATAPPTARPMDRPARRRGGRALRSGVAAVASLALACGMTSLSRRGQDVLPLASDPSSDCARLGEVHGSADPFFGGLKSTDWLLESARNDARNEAARLGATHVAFAAPPERWPSGTFGGGQGLTVTGVAYRCGAPAGAGADGAAREAGGCTKDTDCKGDRVCESGRCVEPRPPSATPRTP